MYSLRTPKIPSLGGVIRCYIQLTHTSSIQGIQGDNSDVLSVLAEHVPIQLPTRYGEKMCFIKYPVSEDRSSIVELFGAVATLRSVFGGSLLYFSDKIKHLY